MPSVGQVLAIKTWHDTNIAARETEWISVNTSGYPQTIFTPVGQHAGNITDETVEADGYTRAHYLGIIEDDFTKAEVSFRVTTAIIGDTEAELGIATGVPTVGAVATLTLAGYADITTECGSTGIKKKTITVSLSKGDHIWICWSQKAKIQGFMAAFRAYIPDNIQSAMFEQIKNTKVSELSSSTLSICSDTLAGMWCCVGMS